MLAAGEEHPGYQHTLGRGIDAALAEHRFRFALGIVILAAHNRNKYKISPNDRLTSRYIPSKASKSRLFHPLSLIAPMRFKNFFAALRREECRITSIEVEDLLLRLSC